jgi:hypothetical protein
MPRNAQVYVAGLLVNLATIATATGVQGQPAGTPIRFQEPAELSIGVVEGNPVEQFYRSAPPSLMGDGSIIVPVRSANEIRVFHSDGGFARTLGRPGDGPGEFRSLYAAWSRGDTIEAWDTGLLRVTRFFPGGGAETVAMRPGTDERGAPSIGVGAVSLGATPDGWLVATVASFGYEEGIRDQVAVHHFGRDGEPLATGIAMVLGIDRVDLGNYTGASPLSPAPRFAYRGTDGGPDEFYTAETLTARIQVTDSYGRPIRSVEWLPDRVWTPREAFDRAVRVVESGREAPFRSRTGIRYAEGWHHVTSPPAEVPVFSDFLVDEEGFVWVRPFVPERDAVALGANLGTGRSGQGGEWTILSPQGDRVGEIQVPDGFEPFQVMSDRVLGIYKDELGVEFVRMYSLVRR